MSDRRDEARGYASRGGLKLRHALDEFGITVIGEAADLGCSTGGFTDCLLRAGASRVYAVDTAYGLLAWSLRQDARVVVMERTNALYATPPLGGVELVAADLSWTPQRLVVPAALGWLSPGGRIITLIKPHYEHTDAGGSLPRGGVLVEAEAERVVGRVVESMAALGARVLGVTRSPVLGGSKGGKGRGNTEWLALLECAG